MLPLLSRLFRMRNGRSSLGLLQSWPPPEAVCRPRSTTNAAALRPIHRLCPLPHARLRCCHMPHTERGTQTGELLLPRTRSTGPATGTCSEVDDGDDASEDDDVAAQRRRAGWPSWSHEARYLHGWTLPPRRTTAHRRQWARWQRIAAYEQLYSSLHGPESRRASGLRGRGTRRVSGRMWMRGLLPTLSTVRTGPSGM